MTELVYQQAGVGVFIGKNGYYIFLLRKQEFLSLADVLHIYR